VVAVVQIGHGEVEFLDACGELCVVGLQFVPVVRAVLLEGVSGHVVEVGPVQLV